MKTLLRATLRVVLTLVILVAGGVGAYACWDYYMLSPWTRDAKVSADVVTIAPDVAGFVTDILVKDNQMVHRGDVLLVIDQARYKRALEMAQANLAARKAEMVMHQHEADRRAKLTQLSITAEDKEDAQHQAASATASYEQAVADLSMAQLNLDRTVLRAPVNGFITNFTLVTGQYASVGTKVLAIIDSDSYRISGYFEETKLSSIKLGDQVEINLMSGAPALKGHVESISRGITDRENADGPEMLANVVPTFEWVRLAQRIPVRIHIDQVPDNVIVSSGMTCTVVVNTSGRKWSLESVLTSLLAGWSAATGRA
jgi:multidrug resistance efflux pump